jgi:hypothetical protein
LIASPSQPNVAAPPTARAGKAAIFVSYRRSDVAHAAHRLNEVLLRRFGKDSTFIDLDQIDAGADFVRTVEGAIGQAKVFLAVIGPGWLTAAKDNGDARLADPGDFVRLEIEQALRRNILVIPVLVDAQMPSAEQLPESLREVAHRNAVPLRFESFQSDCEKLADRIRTALG